MCTTPEYRPFYWLYPGSYQPLQATAILLADLLKSPYSAEAQHSRTLVEKLFSLVGPEGVGRYKEKDSKRNLSNAGKEVWEMLRRLRRQAWIKAGIDPDMVWMDGNFTQDPGASENTATAEQPPAPQLNLAATGISNMEDAHPTNETNAMAGTSGLNQVPDEFWTENPELYVDNPNIYGQFTLGDVDYLDWGEWDSLVDKYFNIPDPGQLNF